MEKRGVQGRQGGASSKGEEYDIRKESYGGERFKQKIK